MSEHRDQPLRVHAAAPEQTAALARAVARLAQVGDIIALIGELGAGKTHFVRGLAEGLGLDPRAVSSPTFVFVQEYEPSESAAAEAPVLVHIDAYRLQDAGDLESIGWADGGAELRDGAVVAIEWADRMRDALGPDWLELSIEHADPGRQISLRGHGSWHNRLARLSP